MRIWLSFDLGVSGDYEGMYAWLDDKNAQECGASVASFLCSDEHDLLTSLKSEIEEAVTLNKRSRVYVVHKDDHGKSKGKFLIGGRKSAPWEGYGGHDETDDDEDL